MRQIAAVVGLTLFIWVLMLLGAYAAFNVYVAHTYMPEIRKALAEADPEDRHAPLVVRRAIHADYPGDYAIASQVARQLHSRIYGDRERNGARMVQQLSIALACLELTEDQRIGLYATFAYNGVDRGLDRLSRRLYSRSLHELSQDQAVTMEVVLRAPAMYLKNPERMEPWRARLLARLRKGDQHAR